MSHCDIRPSQPETPLVIAVCLACHRILPCSLTRPRARNFGPGLVKRGILDWPCLCLVFFFLLLFLGLGFPCFLVSWFVGVEGVEGVEGLWSSLYVHGGVDLVIGGRVDVMDGYISLDPVFPPIPHPHTHTHTHVSYNIFDFLSS